MRKVKNGRVLRRLAEKSFRASRTRNIVAVLAIILTAVLFTSVFTIGLGIVESTQRSAMQQAGGDMHGTIKNITREQCDILKKHPSIRKCGEEMGVACNVENPEFLKRRVEMHYLERDLYPDWFVEILDGEAPEEADEILLDEKSMQLLGLEPAAGQQVTFSLRVHQTDTETVERTFTVSGVIASSQATNVGFAFVSEAYLQKYGEELTAGDAYDFVGRINLHILFRSSVKAQEKLNRIITDSGFSTDPSSPDYINSNANWAYLSDGAGSDPITTAALAAALLLILVTGYLIIYNIFQISVIRDIRYYGLLKTVGATGRQIRRLLRRQALWLCLMGLPAGLILGFGGGKLLLPLILRVGSYEENAVNVSPQPWIFLGASVFTVLTVLVSQWKPARAAGKVSPAEALRYTEHGLRRKGQKRSTDGGRPGRMAFSNLGRNRGRTAVVICSLSLTLVLLNSIYTVTHSINREKVLSKMILSEALIGNTALWNYRYRPSDEQSAAEESLSESFVEAVREQEGFAGGGRIYMTDFNVRMPADTWEIPDYIGTNEEGAPGEWHPDGFEPYFGYEEGAYFVAYHGIEPFVLSKMTVVEGETDTNVIWEKLQSGNYLLSAVNVDDNGLVIADEIMHHAGDRVTLTFDGKETKEYEVLSVVKAHQNSLTNKIHQTFQYYVAADEFKSHLSSAFLMSYLFDAKEGCEDDMVEFLKDYTETAEPAMNYEARATFEGTFNQLLGTVTLVGTALAAVIGFIGLLNFINTILTGVVTRRHEFAMMEAIGMTKRQLSGMLTMEGLYYAFLTMAFSLAAAAAFSLLAIRALGNGLWLMDYRFTLLPMCIACPALLLFGLCVPGIVYALRRKESVVERLRE